MDAKAVVVTARHSGRGPFLEGILRSDNRKPVTLAAKSSATQACWRCWRARVGSQPPGSARLAVTNACQFTAGPA